MNADQAQLAAGGLVPASAKLGKEDAVDAVVARAYRHAVLPGRTVVRLSAENVVAGDELEMATLGFAAGEDRGAVAKERKRPLGFPGWALVHDPKNARYALEVVKELKKHARKAKSKPGHAKEGIDALADVLGKTVPHFLPAFYEEAGRAFIAHGAAGYAAAMFGKAREAEAVHALEVDEQHRVDGFLEFALAGAVTTKALTQYAKELSEHHAPAVAYAHFRQLCLQRTLGGMPPWAGMAKELRRLAKAAKLDTAAEDRAFVADVIESPALANAAAEFWRAYAEPITELGTASAAVRGALLELFPSADDAWLDLLEATGAPVATAGAAWFDKLCAHLARDYRSLQIGDRAAVILRQMAPALIAEGKPITCADRWGQIDLDLVELAIELGVPVAAAGANARVNLHVWAKRAHEPGHGVDPVRTAAHPVMGPLLAAMTAQVLGSEPFDAASRGKAGFLAAKRAWLEALIARAEGGALVGLGEVIETVSAKVKAETFADLPDLHARFAALDPVPALARSLRIGLIDELGWPALEDAARELDPDGSTLLVVHGGAPAVVLASKTRAIAVGPGGRLGVHDFVIPPQHELVTARWIGGQFLVALKLGYTKLRGYWSSAPHDVFDSEAGVWSVPEIAPRAAVLPDGAWLERDKPLRPGDRRLPEGVLLAASDGATSWVIEWRDGKHRWREVSATGELGRASWPAFVEAGIEGDWQIDTSASYVLPLPGAPASPLGVKDGLAGVRVRFRPSGEREIETIDGRRWSGRLPVTGLLALPGADRPRVVTEQTSWRSGIEATLIDADTLVAGAKVGHDHIRYRMGQVKALPPILWHWLTPRDEPGSRRLRAATDADARALLAGALAATGRSAAERIAALEAGAIARVFPEISHPRLRDGIHGYLKTAAQHLADKDKLAAERAPATAGARAAAGPTDQVLRLALGGWCTNLWGQEGSAWAQLDATAAFFASADRSDRFDHELPHSRIDWLDFAVARFALPFLALAIGTPADHRPALAELAAHIARVLPPADKLRVYTANGKLDLPGEGTGYRVRWHQGNAYVTRSASWQPMPLRILEYAPSGQFRPLPGLSHAGELRGLPAALEPAEPAALDPAALDDAGAAALTSAIAAGTTSWSPEAAARLADATGLTASEAAYLWAGMPSSNVHGASFLAKEVREAIGLKATQAAVARDGLVTIPEAKRLAAIDAAGRRGVAALLDGSASEALAAAWTKLVGKRLAVPEELIGDADRELQAPIEPSPALAMIAAGRDAPELTTDAFRGLTVTGDVVIVAAAAPLVGQPKLETEARVFTEQVMHALAVYLPFLYAELPVGDPLRAQAPVAHELGLARLANRHLWMAGGAQYLGDDAAKAGADKLVASIGGEPVTGLDPGLRGVHVPGAVLVLDPRRLRLVLSAGELDAKATASIGRIATSFANWSYAPWRSLEYLRSPGLAAMMARIGDTPVPPGGWEQNPAASVPKLVARAAKRLEVSSDAAALYLQYLTLLWPTPKQLLLWNGWKPKQLAAATEELVGAELILEAKRERAQRGHFLPGGWEALKSPHPPMETWKVPLYGTRNAQGDPEPPLGRFLAIAPFHALFEAAWQRIEDGDVPRYDEVKKK